MKQEITPERWQQIERLYHSALEHDSSQRGAFLQQACAGDDALREEVESLWRKDELPMACWTIRHWEKWPRRL